MDTRTEDGRLGDLNKNGVWDAGLGEGLGAIDYGGINGPDKDRLDQRNAFYLDNRGTLLNILGSGSTSAPPVHLRKITDGLSHTMIVAELSGRGGLASGSKFELGGAWGSGQNCYTVGGNTLWGANAPIINSDPLKYAWPSEEIYPDHPSGANVLLCDGSVQFLDDEIDRNIVVWLCSRDGGEIVHKWPF
jgi:prepilin-type processing-associated H-X9-DG protein